MRACTRIGAFVCFAILVALFVTANSYAPSVAVPVDESHSLTIPDRVLYNVAPVALGGTGYHGPWSDVSIRFVLIVLAGMCLAFCIFAMIVGRMLTRIHDAKQKNAAPDGNETRMIQELYSGFNRMEDRIEALETILLERERERSHELR